MPATVYPGQPRWFSRHPTVALSTAVLLGCVVLIMLAEVSMRALLPQWAPEREERTKFWTYDDLLGWAQRPNQRGRFNHRDFSVEVAVNSAGLRAREYSVARTGKKRMLVLGDSFAWGFGVEQRDRFSEVLEAAHPEWEIINAAVSGYGTDQEFLYLRERGIAVKPDVVLLLFCWNDFDNNIHSDQYWYFKPMFTVDDGQLVLHNVPVPKAVLRQRFERWFVGTTYLGWRVHIAKEAVLARMRSDGSGNPDDERRMVAVTGQLISSMNDVCKQNGARFVMVSTPMDERMRTRLLEVADSQGIPYLPLDAPFDSTATPITFPHDRHWSAAGHKVAARAIDTFLFKAAVFVHQEAR